MKSIVVIIPTKRKPPIKTLSSYSVKGYPIIILADPEVYEDHRKFYGSDVFPGVPGQGANKSRCYEVAFQHGFPYYFRMDDDLAEKTFVGIDKDHYPELDYVIKECYRCLHETQTSLVGLFNGTNRFWMKKEYGRTYGLVHGGANLSISAPDGKKFLDPRIIRGEDVYRTCAHRKMNGGYVGRVNHIGFDKRQSTIIAGQSSIVATREEIDASTQLVLDTFPGMVTCDGTREIFGGFVIANWRMKRGMGYDSSQASS